MRTAIGQRRTKRIIPHKRVYFNIRAKSVECLIFRLHKKDIRRVCKLNKLAFSFLGRNRHILNWALNRKYMSYLLSSQCSYYGMEYNNQLIAAIGLKCAGVFVGEIEILAILPKFQNKGIGSQLIKFAKYWAKRGHYTRLDVGTYDLLNAVGFYKKHGFKITHHEKDGIYSYWDLAYRIK